MAATRFERVTYPAMHVTVTAPSGDFGQALRPDLSDVWFTTCHNNHGDVGKYVYHYQILRTYPGPVPKADLLIYETKKTIHMLCQECTGSDTTLIAEHGSAYGVQIQEIYEEHYHSNPWAPLDDYIGDLGIPYGDGDTSPGTVWDPNDPEDKPPPTGSQPTEPTDPERPEDKPEDEPAAEEDDSAAEEEEEARDELEDLQDRLDELESSGPGQMFVDPRSDWMQVPRVNRFKRQLGKHRIYTTEFSWCEKPGREPPAQNAQYYSIRKTQSQTFVARHSLAIKTQPGADKKKSLNFVDGVEETIVLPVGPVPQYDHYDQRTLNELWLKAIGASEWPVADPSYRVSLSAVDRAVIGKDAELIADLAPEYRMICNIANGILGVAPGTTRAPDPASSNAAYAVATHIVNSVLERGATIR